MKKRRLMKKLLQLVIFVSIPATSFAQWKADVGLNVIPLMARSVEISSELRRHPAYSLNFNVGYTFKSGHIGLADYKVYDFITKRRTSGGFLKAGGRIYLTGLSGKERKTDFFVGAQVIVSQYHQTAIREPIDGGQNYVGRSAVSANGIIVSPAVSFGLARELSKKLSMDCGVQKSFVTDRDDYIGRSARNYQPGMGSGQSDPFIGYLQGILALRYRIN